MEDSSKHSRTMASPQPHGDLNVEPSALAGWASGFQGNAGCQHGACAADVDVDVGVDGSLEAGALQRDRSTDSASVLKNGELRSQRGDGEVCSCPSTRQGKSQPRGAVHRGHLSMLNGPEVAPPAPPTMVEPMVRRCAAAAWWECRSRW